MRNLEKELASIIRSGLDQMPPLSPYGSAYLSGQMRALNHNLQIAGILLSSVKANMATGQSPVILDFGGGLGLNCLLAKMAGFEKVIYCDRYDEVCADAKILGKHLKLEADDYVHGSIEDVLAKYKGEVTSIISKDVIEHIYDLESFFRKTAEFSQLSCMAHNSSANIYNLLLKNYFKKVHLAAENIPVNRSNNRKKNETEIGYKEERLRMIKDQFPDFDESEAYAIAVRTRGKITKDIIGLAGSYRESGTLPEPIAHPTNTCDPNTGNWAERLLTFDEYIHFAEAGNFSCDFTPVPYNRWHPNPLKRVVNRTLNMLTMNGIVGKQFWSSFLLIARPTE